MALNQDDIPIKQLAYGILIREGIANKDACKALDYHKDTGYRVKKKVAKLDIADSKHVSAAFRAHNKIIRGQAVGDADPPKTSDINRCIDRVIERHQPAKQITVSTTISLVGSIAELTEFQNAATEPTEGHQPSIGTKVIVEVGQGGQEAVSGEVVDVE